MQQRLQQLKKSLSEDETTKAFSIILSGVILATFTQGVGEVCLISYPYLEMWHATKSFQIISYGMLSTGVIKSFGFQKTINCLFN